MALIIYGLGNNDKKYFNTKHNAGRIVLEKLALDFGLNFEQKENYFFTKTDLELEHKKDKVYFLFSSGYMNDSGLPLENFIKYFKLVPSETGGLHSKARNDVRILILQDDSDQIEGRQKLLPAGGSGGHNGINSIYKHLLNLGLSSDNIWRLKIGIRPENNKLKSETFVLKSINNFEKEYYQKLSIKLKETLGLIFEGNWSDVQTEINSFKIPTKIAE